MRRIWVAQAQQGAGATPVEKLPLLARVVYDKCDAADGLKDGIIDDPRRCGFDAARDLPKCAGAEGADCFTAPQIAAIAKIYGGPHDSKGKRLFPGEPVGAEPVWAENLVGPSKLVLPRAESQMKFAMLTPPPGPSWNYTMFNFDTDPARLQAAGKELNALNHDLSPLKKRGGKIIQYSGWADQQVNPFPGIDYYETVSKHMGASTRDFYRLFMVPGMFHCNGGPGCSSVDWLTPLMEWVEKGKAPDQITGAHIEKGETKRTRPLCPYPQVAKYKGSGSIDEADNFTCASR
jgi:feruloyl esterase